MKEKILTFIIGVLVGAIIATGGYYFYSKSNTKDFKGKPDGDRPAMMQDENSSSGDSTNRRTPPEKPSDDGKGPKGTSEQQNDSTSNTQDNKTNTDNSENNV